jgi:hypothetical protein
MEKPVVRSVSLVSLPPANTSIGPVGQFCCMCGGTLESKHAIFVWDEWGVKYKIHNDCVPSHFLAPSNSILKGECLTCGFGIHIQCDSREEEAISRARMDFLHRHKEDSPLCEDCPLP